MGCHLCQNSTFFRHCVFHGYLRMFHDYLQITVEYAWLFTKSWLFMISVVIYEKHGYLQNHGYL